MKGQEEARPPPLSPLPIRFIYFVHVCFGGAGGCSACGSEAASAAGNPSQRRRGPARPRPIPAPALRGGHRREEGGREWERQSREKEAAGAREEAGKPARPAPGRSFAGCRWSRGGSRFRRRRLLLLPGASSQAGRLLARDARSWRPARGARSSSMAEGRRREDEDEELHERRELGGPRRARGRALSGQSAAGEGRGQREGGPGQRGPRAGRPGAAQVLPRTPAAPSPARRGLAPLTLGGEREGEWLFYPHPHFGAEPEEIQTCLYLLVALEPKLQNFHAD